jgi:hypothetical protein
MPFPFPIVFLSLLYSENTLQVRYTTINQNVKYAGDTRHDIMLL